jgi:diguanylate cyclase (GGDEF)-like protein/PAS domain S-box-containing protein
MINVGRSILIYLPTLKKSKNFLNRYGRIILTLPVVEIGTIEGVVMKFKNIRIGILYKFIGVTLIPVIILLLSTVFVLHDVQVSSYNFAIESQSYSPLMINSEQILRRFYRWDDDLNMAVLAAMDHREAMVAPQIADALHSQRDVYADLLNASKIGMPSSDYHRLTRELGIYSNYSKHVIHAIHAGNLHAAITTQLVTNANISTMLTNDLTNIKNYYNTRYQTINQVLNQSMTALRYTLYIASLLALLLSLTVAILLANRQVKQVQRLVFSLMRVASGDRQFDVIGKVTNDEIGDAFYALNNTVTMLNEAEINLQEQLEFSQLLLDSIPVPAFYKGVDGRFVHVNHAFEVYHGLAESDLVNKTVFDLAPVVSATEHHAKDTEILNKISTMVYESIAYDAHGIPHDVIFHKAAFKRPDGQVGGIIGVMIDISEHKEAERHIQFLNQIYMTLAQTNQMIVRCKDETTLFNDVCQIAVEFGGMELAWIGRPDEAHGDIRPVATAGANLPWSELKFSLREDQPGGIGIVSPAIRENHPVIIQRYQEDERTAIWRHKVQQFNFKAAAAFPIVRGGTVYAALTVFHAEQDVFDQKMIALLTEMCMDIGFALDQFDIAERHIAAEQQIHLSAQVFEQSHEGIAITDANGTILTVNKAFTEITGYSAEEVIGHQTKGQGIEFYRSKISVHHKNGHWQGEVWNTRRDGSEYLEWLSITQVLDNEDNVTNYISIFTDMTERKQAEQALLESERRWKDIVDFLPDATFVIDKDFKVIAWNRVMEDMTGIPKQDMLGKSNYEYAIPFYGERRPILIDLVLNFEATHAENYNNLWLQGDTLFGETVATHLPSGQAYLSATASLLRDPNGEVIAVIESIRDVTEQKMAQEQIQHLAHFDPLTGLPNRLLLADRAKQLINWAQRNDGSFSLMFLDLDHFKNINDTLGHEIGDMLLIEVAKRLSFTLREQDTVSRIGGDEFIILLPDTEDDHVAHVAQKIIHIVSLPYHINGFDLTTTPSIGIAVYPTDGDDWEALYKHADIAMYRVKNDGRNSYCFFTTEMQQHSDRRLQLENALRMALDRNELFLYYQPIVSLKLNSAIGVEALLRWQHPTLGMISPAEFIPIAEDSGLIVPIGEWVLKTAIRQMKQWLDLGLQLQSVAVNLSALQLKQSNFPNLVINILKKENLPSRYLELEITETIAMKEPEKAIEIMRSLHQEGVRMSIDDFGTGYSSLAYLNRFPIDKLKIDQSFVRDIDTDPDDEAIVKAVISMAKSLRITTIAEGVESEEELQLIRLNDCDEVQGYYFSRPLPADELLTWMRNKNKG